jgi:two-component sensor histidine kinase
VGTFEIDLQTGAGRWNSVEYELLGLKPGEAPSTPETFFHYVHPDDIGRVQEEWEEATQKGFLDTEFRVVRADGQVRWLAGLGQFAYAGQDHDAVPGARRKAVRFLGVNFDITRRKLAEENLQASLREKEVMLKEIHHRVKNNLQVVSSLVDLQADSLNDPAMLVLLQDVRDRVRSMALVHEKLYQSNNLALVEFDEYVRSLLNYLWRAHRNSEVIIQLAMDLEPAALSVETAVPCGLILNELAVNALKHAFAGRTEGRVTVTLRRGADDRIQLGVRDDGIGLPEDLDWRQARSLGLRLVQMLARQLDGSVEATTDGGTTFIFTFQPTTSTASHRI